MRRSAWKRGLSGVGRRLFRILGVEGWETIGIQNFANPQKETKKDELSFCGIFK